MRLHRLYVLAAKLYSLGLLCILMRTVTGLNRVDCVFHTKKATYVTSAHAIQDYLNFFDFIQLLSLLFAVPHFSSFYYHPATYLGFIRGKGPSRCPIFRVLLQLQCKWFTVCELWSFLNFFTYKVGAQLGPLPKYSPALICFIWKIHRPIGLLYCSTWHDQTFPLCRFL